MQDVAATVVLNL